MKKMYIIGIIVVLLVLSFLPLWKKPVKSGDIRINTWKQIMVKIGLIHID